MVLRWIADSIERGFHVGGAPKMELTGDDIQVCSNA